MKTRDKLIYNSFKLFAELGYGSASIRTIARQSGIKESAVYNHFSSKADIFTACIGRFNSLINDNSIFNEELLEALSEPEDFFKTATDKLTEKWLTDDSILAIKFLLSAQSSGQENSPTILSVIDESKKIWVLVFTELIKHKVIKDFEPELMAESFIEPLFISRLKYLINNFDPEKLKKSIEQHHTFFWNQFGK